MKVVGKGARAVSDTRCELRNSVFNFLLPLALGVVGGVPH